VRGVRIALLAVALALGGCGADSKPGLTSGQSQALVAQLEAARASAATADVPGTKAALVRFRRSVARLQRDGALSAATARLLRTGAQRVLHRLVSDTTPAAPATAVTQTTPAPAPQPPGRQKKKDKHDKKHDKGKKHGDEE
jgi:hypothetical protein